MSEQQPEAVEESQASEPYEGDGGIEGQEAILVEEPAETDEHEEPGVAGDPDHGLPGDAEEMPEGDAEVQE